VDAFLVSIGVIFLAEFGDKSQLMALAFATRYRAALVLLGITLSTAVVHALSVGLGAAIGVTVPTGPVTVLAGAAFLAFAAWTLRGDTLDARDSARAARTARSALLAVSVTFFLAELGDKTMLATVTLATREAAFGTWVGSTLGMVAADAAAIGVGRQLGARLPDRTVRIGAAVAFAVFGVLLVVEGLTR
jgi:putative Ca2+/H+ antiporter (TMEM165/GDT1 family)